MKGNGWILVVTMMMILFEATVISCQGKRLLRVIFISIIRLSIKPNMDLVL